jgi:hypothetical protein
MLPARLKVRLVRMELKSQQQRMMMGSRLGINNDKMRGHLATIAEMTIESWCETEDIFYREFPIYES